MVRLLVVIAGALGGLAFWRHKTKIYDAGTLAADAKIDAAADDWA